MGVYEQFMGTHIISLESQYMHGAPNGPLFTLHMEDCQWMTSQNAALLPLLHLRAPCLQIIPTLGPKVYKSDLQWATGSPRETCWRSGSLRIVSPG